MKLHKLIGLGVLMSFMLAIPYQIFAQKAIDLPLNMAAQNSEQPSKADNIQITNSFKLYLDDITTVSPSPTSPTLANGFDGFDFSVLGDRAQPFQLWLTYERDRCLSNPFNENGEALTTSCRILERTLRGELTDFERWTIAKHGGMLLSGGVFSTASDFHSEISAASATEINGRHPSTGDVLNIWISSGWWSSYLGHYTMAGGPGGHNYAQVDMQIRNRNPLYDETYTTQNGDSVAKAKHIGWFTGGRVNIDVKYIANDGWSDEDSEGFYY